MFDLTTYLSHKRKQVDDTLEQIFKAPTASDIITSAMRYSVMAGGKRLRPILCLASIEAVGGDFSSEIALKTAGALEMVHTYSLIHDDLPAMDNDDLRRGKPTCHIAFDEPSAILAGDALVTLAFQTIAEINCQDDELTLKLIDIIQSVASAAGHRGMIAGQMIDISSEGTRLSLDDLQHMYRLKTGALIETSIYTGAVIGDGSKRQIDQLKTYAQKIGLAFQIADDILNVQGDPAIMGKSAGTDEIRQKTTYPAVVGIDQSKETMRQLVDNALQAIEDFDNNSDPLRAIATYIIDRNV
ncbi:polyprenyl synthetase family protein [Thermodesulfobacteriota bacterium]